MKNLVSSADKLWCFEVGTKGGTKKKCKSNDNFLPVTMQDLRKCPIGLLQKLKGNGSTKANAVLRESIKKIKKNQDLTQEFKWIRQPHHPYLLTYSNDRLLCFKVGPKGGTEKKKKKSENSAVVGDEFSPCTSKEMLKYSLELIENLCNRGSNLPQILHQPLLFRHYDHLQQQRQNMEQSIMLFTFGRARWVLFLAEILLF